MFRILLAIACLSGTFTAYAQDPSKNLLAPCGTAPGISPWLRAYNSKPLPGAPETLEDTIWVALQVHVLNKDSGTGHFNYDRVLEALCRLNTDYAPAKIQFYLKNPIDTINRSAWFNHADIPEGINMMLTSNVEGAFNTYFVSNPAGNCGYNIPYAGVAIGHGCAGAGDHTWAHEAGHALSLPHPFIGWEGKTYSFGIPTPELLTYDYTYFHDTIDTQVPAPLDTALVELLDGSNCHIAADLFCDSKPDYLSDRWDCDAANKSLIKQKDPAGAEFYSDGTLFMSYANDACQSRFSTEEIAAMRTNLMTEKVDWVSLTPPGLPVTELATAVEPIQDQPVPVTGANLRWSAVPNATYYLVQASRIINFAIREVDVITTDTNLVLGTLVLNKKYYWRVKAFNAWHPCSEFTESATFVTAPVSATYAPDKDGWRCYPSLVSSGQPLQIEVPESWLGSKAQLCLFDVAGRQVWVSDLTLEARKIKTELPGGVLKTGMYQLVMTNNKGMKRQALFIESH